jgi:hypothetical protein
LLKLLVSYSGDPLLVACGEDLDGLQRGRQLAAGGSVAGANNQAALKAADYQLHAKLLYSDNDPGSSGGRLTPAGHNVGSEEGGYPQDIHLIWPPLGYPVDILWLAIIYQTPYHMLPYPHATISISIGYHSHMLSYP